MKGERQARILDILSKNEVHTQEEITELLRAEGFKVTQATVSRDLRELRLTKNMSSKGGYKYGTNNFYVNMNLNNSIVQSIVDVRYAMNNVVIKTYPGMAQAIASGVDSLQYKTILGCVAGDDTIIIVTETESGAEELCWQLRELMKGR